MTVRVGVIGTGIMGADHANTVHRKLSGADLVAVTDVDAARAQAVADSAGAAVLTDGFVLVDDPSVDAIVVASHDSTHAELTMAAIRAGKPVLCEKPLAPTVAQCAAVVSAERAAVGGGIPLVSVGFMRRFDPGYVQLKAALRAGRVGPAVVVHGYSRGVSAGPGATSESSVTGSAIHEFDCVPWLCFCPSSTSSGSCWPTACSATSTPCWPITGSCGTIWPGVRCSIWARTRCRSRSSCSARRPRSSRSAVRTRRASTARSPRS